MADKLYSVRELVFKIVGPIGPIGETETDNKRFDNLKDLIKLVDGLLDEINDVARENLTANEFSRKRAGQYASKCLKEFAGYYNP